MKNKLLFLFVLIGLNASAQEVAMGSKNFIPYIEVTGKATNEIEPDQIYVSITLSEKSIENRKYSIEAQEEKLKQILLKWNISAANLTLSDLNSQIIRDKKNEIEFKQSKEYILLLKNSDEVSKIFRELFDAHIKEADVVKTNHTNIAEFTKQARINAIKAAKEKAGYLLDAIGKTPGEPLEIIEIRNAYADDSGNNGNFNYYRGNLYSKDKEDQAISSSEFKKITISVSYKVKYSIK